MGKNAARTRVGTESEKVTYPTSNTEQRDQAMSIPTCSGAVGRVIPLATPDRSLQLSDAEARTLARIRKDRRNGFMVSAVDVDFLLEVIARTR